jgi:hypothetical protein
VAKATIFWSSFVRAEARTLQGSDLLLISAVAAGPSAFVRAHQRRASAKAQDRCSRLFPGVLKHSFPRMNAGAPTLHGRTVVNFCSAAGAGEFVCVDQP